MTPLGRLADVGLQGVKADGREVGRSKKTPTGLAALFQHVLQIVMSPAAAPPHGGSKAASGVKASAAERPETVPAIVAMAKAPEIRSAPLDRHDVKPGSPRPPMPARASSPERTALPIADVPARGRSPEPRVLPLAPSRPVRIPERAVLAPARSNDGPALPVGKSLEPKAADLHSGRMPPRVSAPASSSKFSAVPVEPPVAFRSIELPGAAAVKTRPEILRSSSHTPIRPQAPVAPERVRSIEPEGSPAPRAEVRPRLEVTPGAEWAPNPGHDAIHPASVARSVAPHPTASVAREGAPAVTSKSPAPLPSLPPGVELRIAGEETPKAEPSSRVKAPVSRVPVPRIPGEVAAPRTAAPPPVAKIPQATLEPARAGRPIEIEAAPARAAGSETPAASQKPSMSAQEPRSPSPAPAISSGIASAHERVQSLLHDWPRATGRSLEVRVAGSNGTSIDLKARLDGGLVRAELHSVDPSIQASLASRLPDMRRHLEQLGIAVSALAVRSDGAPDRRDGGDAREAGRRPFDPAERRRSVAARATQRVATGEVDYVA